MEEKNSNKEPKLRMLNELSPDAQSYNYGDYDYGYSSGGGYSCGSGYNSGEGSCGCGSCGCGCGSCGCGSCGCGSCGCGSCGCGSCGCGSCGEECSSGCGRADGSSPDNCMSEARYWQLYFRGEINKGVFICGLGYAMPGITVEGELKLGGLGSGPKSCMPLDLFQKFDELGLLTKMYYVCGEGWKAPNIPAFSGSGYGCGCGSCGCGSCGCGEDIAPATLIEARKYQNVIKSKILMSRLGLFWDLMKQSAANNQRREYGCWLFYNEAHRKYYIGKTIEGPIVYGGDPGSIPFGTTNCDSNLVPKQSVPIGVFHVHTTLTYSSSGTKVCGPSNSDIDMLKKFNVPDSFGFLLDYSADSLNCGHSIDEPVSLYIYTANGLQEKKPFKP